MLGSEQSSGTGEGEEEGELSPEPEWGGDSTWGAWDLVSDIQGYIWRPWAVLEAAEAADVDEGQKCEKEEAVSAKACAKVSLAKPFTWQLRSEVHLADMTWDAPIFDDTWTVKKVCSLCLHVAIYA